MAGRLVELRTCGAHCPCRVEGEPDGSTCDAVNVWHIDRGTIGETHISGLNLVALSLNHGHVLKGRSIVFYVDDMATDEQQMALLNLWTGNLGGPIADVAQSIGVVTGVERAAIDFQVKDGQGTLTVGQVIDARLAAGRDNKATLVGASGADSPLRGEPHDLAAGRMRSVTGMGSHELYHLLTM
ncbi:MAG: DUF1326 domain-containing protein [Chloroflexi bacterium]|nr:DUF1326 domain-containing protein [Chloroflexota bacterium]